MNITTTCSTHKKVMYFLIDFVFKRRPRATYAISGRDLAIDSVSAGPLLVIFALGMCYSFVQNTVSLQRKIFKRWNGKERQFVFIAWVYVGV